MLSCPYTLPRFPCVQGVTRIKPGSPQLILPFSLLNAVILMGQGTGHSVMDNHSYSNAAFPSGPHPPLTNFHEVLHPLDPLGEKFLFKESQSWVKNFNSLYLLPCKRNLYYINL